MQLPTRKSQPPCPAGARWTPEDGLVRSHENEELRGDADYFALREKKCAIVLAALNEPPQIRLASVQARLLPDKGLKLFF